MLTELYHIWFCVDAYGNHRAAAAAKSLSRVQLFVTPGTAAHQAPPSMGFSKQDYWSGLPLPSQTIVQDNYLPTVILVPSLLDISLT